MGRVRAWLQSWLTARRGPLPLRQCAWCANGLHHHCTGHTDHGRCRCPCRAFP
jgi:hypothetical protein